MTIMTGNYSAALAALAVMGSHGAAQAADETARAELADDPVLVEMFLSQACRLSPPAADIMSALSTRPDVVALSWHVGYWNAVAAESGHWDDPFARDAFAARQRLYNRQIRGRSTVFTPQAIVNGAESGPGGSLDSLVAVIDREETDAAADPFFLTVEKRGDHGYRVEADGADAPYDVAVVVFIPAVETLVEAGDNAGQVFREINVVTDARVMETTVEGRTAFDFDTPADQRGCAVIAQESGQGRVLAARYCP